MSKKNNPKKTNKQTSSPSSSSSSSSSFKQQHIKHQNQHQHHPSKNHSNNKASFVKRKEVADNQKTSATRIVSPSSPETTSPMQSPNSNSLPSVPPKKSPHSKKGGLSQPHHHKNSNISTNNNNSNNNNGQPNNHNSFKKKEKYHQNNHSTTGGSGGNGTTANKSNKKQQDKRNKNNHHKQKKNKKQQGKNNHCYTGKLPLTQQQKNKLKPKALAQVEYFFSTTELAKNVFLRRYMDVCGFIPFAIIYNFPSVSSFHIPYDELLNTVNDSSKKIEVDSVNECVRIKGGEDCYKKWLFPNPDGTFGCPRWIKEIEAAAEPAPATTPDAEGVVTNEESSGNVDSQLEVDVDASGVDSTIFTGRKEVVAAVGKNSTEEEGETSSETTSTNSSVESSESDEKEHHSTTDAAKGDRGNGRMPDLLAMTDSDTDHSQ